MTTNTQMTTEERDRLAEILEMGSPVGNLSSLEPNIVRERDELLRKLADGIDLLPLIEKSPAMYEIGALAKRKVPNAVRLWLQPRVHVRLHQNPPEQLRMPDQQIGWNGVLVTVPRGRKVEVPQVFAEICEQGEVY